MKAKKSTAKKTASGRRAPRARKVQLGVFSNISQADAARIARAVAPHLAYAALANSASPKKAPEGKARFIKLDASGAALPASAADWAQVIDNETGLIWMADASKERMTFPQAKTYAESLGTGAASWRLPTIKELLSLVDYTRHSPAIDTEFFRCESAFHWSSTPVASSPSVCARYVGFYGGNSYYNYQSYDAFVRAVRSAPASQ